MRAHEVEVQPAGVALADEPGIDGANEARRGRAASRIAEQLGGSAETARAMLEAEETLGVLREQFERTEDPVVQGKLAAEALDNVERELRLMRGRRHELDSIEGALWARRNRLERFLIQARGRDWWRAHRARS
jgi:hypothetical protein